MLSQLNDVEIRSLCLDNELITPFNEELLNPTSYDVRLGEMIMIENPPIIDELTGEIITPPLSPVYIHQFTKEKPYLIFPGQWILVCTIEQFNLPKDISAELKLKSSLARMGWSRAGAEWGDPGWHGSNYTFSIKNWTQYQTQRIYPGMKIGQVEFRRSAPVGTSYAVKGHYNNTKGVHTSIEPNSPLTNPRP